MTVILQILAILCMIVVTYVGLLAFGPPRATLLYSAEDKQRWDEMVRRTFGSWLTSTNIIGTLTSFATVFLFFLGNVGIFGWYILICTLTIWLGAFATNYLTRRICADPYVKGLLDSPDQTGGIISSLFWRDNPRSQHSSRIVKVVSLLNIAAIIWLEFALLTDVGGKLLRLDSLTARSILLFVGALSVFYFVLRFGLRGFVFADIFQTPIIAVATVVLLLGAGLAVARQAGSIDLASLLAPSADAKTIALFCLHVLFLNSFLVVVTEPHWLRVWIFREKETTIQTTATFATALVWALLIVGGVAARALAPQAIGEAAVVSLAQATASISPVFLVAFWFAGIAALFSTADANIYSLLVVHGFDGKTGHLRQRNLELIRPGLFSLIAAIVFVALYLAVRGANLPFEKLIFLIIPLGLNLLPGLVQLAFGRRANPLWLYLSLISYAGFSLYGFLQPQDELAATLAAAIVPVLISIGLFIAYRVRQERPDSHSPSMR